MVHIGLNAHLLSGQTGYRSAGIHGYIHNTLRHLAEAAPPEWDFTALVGAQVTTPFPGLALRRSHWNTESPYRRILWEQTIQPWGLGGFDLYHALTFVSPLLLARPSVVTVYDLSFIHYPQMLSPARRQYLRLFTGLSCRRARRVIAISQSTARDLAESLGIPPEKIDVAVPGYAADIHRPLPVEEVTAFRQQNGLPERFWLFLGTLEPRKNLVTLLEAYARLPRQERPPLVLAGGKGWDYAPIFAAVERLGLSDAVHFPGFVPIADLPLWYNSAELFIYPSVFEGFGLPVLEAMACGTPVIVSDASSLPEVAGDAGILVPPHDVAAWIDALHRAGTDTNWRKSAKQRGIAYAAQFTWRATAQATIASYQKALL
jgi:glycosyltransferase involved in cell wall biosynthesis